MTSSKGTPATASVAARLMDAVVYESYGGGPDGLKHVKVPIPSPKKDEVLLKLEAASLNASDWKIQKGVFRPLLPRKFPFIPAVDVAGEVVENGGGLAEFAIASETFITSARPPEVSAAEGAGLPSSGLTAHQALTKAAGIKLDGTGQLKNILITGASGGVGHYVVQLAKLGNTHVTATCGAHNVDIVKSLGADEVLDYKTPDGAALKSPSGRKYDVVIHCASAGIPWSTFELNLSANGKVIDLTSRPSTWITIVLQRLSFSRKQLVPLIINPKGENLDYLVELMKEGKLKTLVDSKHHLSKAEDAWARKTDGYAIGKIIVET